MAEPTRYKINKETGQGFRELTQKEKEAAARYERKQAKKKTAKKKTAKKKTAKKKTPKVMPRALILKNIIKEIDNMYK